MKLFDQRLLRRVAKLPRRVRQRLWRYLSCALPPRGRLPADWNEQIAPAVGPRTWRDHFAGGQRLSWFWTVQERQRIIRALKSDLTAVASRVQHRADRYRQGYVPILGFGDTLLPENVNWSVDPISGQPFPMMRAERVPRILPDTRTDVKHVWEPARFHCLPNLAVAFALTDDHRYAEAFRERVIDFIVKNPCGYGIQWTNPMEVAIRALNWMAGWAWCGTASCFDETFVRRFIGALIEHGRFIAANLERTRRGINTNHTIADFLGLYALSVFLPEWPESARWRRLAKEELLAELDVQVLADGFCYESSFGYQRLTFEMWYFFWRLAARQGEKGLEPLEDTLRRMAEFSAWNADPRGHLPSFGDGDDGRLVFWEPREPTDHAHVWQLAAAAFGALDLPPGHVSPRSIAEDVLWLGGLDAYQRLSPVCKKTKASSRRTAAKVYQPKSRLFPEAQIAVLRSDRWLVHTFANPVGTGGIGGHKHNDMLSFTALCDGVPVIIDPGTFAYTADPSARVCMRRTDAHATVVVDGAEQNRFIPGQLFCLWPDASPEVVSFEDNEDHARIVMRHDGYRRLRQGVVVERELVLNKHSETLRIFDRLRGHGLHRVQIVFPLGNRPARIVGETSVILGDTDTGEVMLQLEAPCDVSLAVVPGWRSRSYGRREGHRRLVLTAHVHAPIEWTTTLTAVPHEQSSVSSLFHYERSPEPSVAVPGRERLPVTGNVYAES